ncbi:hypothetical protein CDAR_309251 [Caerostris darwini]|uniref:C2H2-type domain-containing protein n=1 Tax=Caerostris darwini TaxID=1538125 RepID=A0AAV4QKA4_9ARAC|nr:hypothetical protein CDAR_309251 [Caerostris darwini]
MCRCDRCVDGSIVGRQNSKISLSFPIQGKILCPESDCSASFVGKFWNTIKGFLIKHLWFVHGISIATYVFTCNICHQNISGNPKEHLCFKSDDNPLVIHVEQELKCTSCPASFSSSLGLQNHLKAPDKSAALSQVTPLSIPTSRRRKKKSEETWDFFVSSFD